MRNRGVCWKYAVLAPNMKEMEKAALGKDAAKGKSTAVGRSFYGQR